MGVEILGYAFFQRALVAGAAIAVSCSLLGVFLVLRRYAMIGDGLAHVGFAAVAIGLIGGLPPISLAIPIVAAASLLIIKLGDGEGLFGDTAIGLVSAVAMAIGIVLASLSSGFTVDVFSYLFGSILAVQTEEVWYSLILMVCIVAGVIFFYHDLFSVTYDTPFSRTVGIRASLIHRVLIVLSGITVAVGIRIVGSLLISSMIIFPAVSALLLSRGFRTTLVASVIVALVSVAGGMILSLGFNLPTGASIVLVNAFIFGLIFILRRAGVLNR